MASPAASISRQEATALMRQVQGNQLFNRQLSSVCQVNGLKSTGVKADLQRRIINLIQETVDAEDVSRFQQVRQSVINAFAQRSSPAKATSTLKTHSPSHASLHTHLPYPMTSYGAASTTPSREYHVSTTATSNGYRPGGSYGSPAIHVTFRSSPFYHVEAPVSEIRICEVMAQHRNSVIIPIKLNEQPSLQQCVNDKSYRVMVFCAAEISDLQDIAFPHQSELRVNGGEIKANLRGLKNKPGSTRPVDITSSLRLRPHYTNNVEFTYALTNKAGGHHKFYLLVNLCRVTPVPELVSMISTRRRIPKDSVIAELNKIAQDTDVVATSQVLSLKCPLSYMRLDVPCRSLSCTHIQCFDATSYLQLQEQGPQWLCPICNKSAPFEQLAVDEYVRDILENTPKSLETVTIEPKGRWFIKSSQEERPGYSNGSSFDDDDDDDVEISEISVVGGHRLETPKQPTPTTGTPISSGRDGIIGALRAISTTSAKRPASAVIDLTLSSDDDEPVQRPTKRQHTETNGYRDSNGSRFLSDSPLG